MTENQKKIEQQNRAKLYVNNAIEQFNNNEQYLISKDLSERCICSKFAMYLEREINLSEDNKYVVDVEYNRGSKGNEYAKKMLDGKLIVVDLIVHKRGYDDITGFDNFICIEMKKDYKNYCLDDDKNRLSILTNPSCGFKYKAGFMIVAISDSKRDEYILKINSSFFDGKEY